MQNDFIFHLREPLGSAVVKHAFESYLKLSNLKASSRMIDIIKHFKELHKSGILFC